MTAASSGTATITSVNTAKSVITLLGQTNSNGTELARITLTNSTTVTATKYTTNYEVIVSYQVEEFY